MAEHKRGERWGPGWNGELYSLYSELYSLYSELHSLYSELHSLYSKPVIVEDIEIRKLGWAGHVIRMEGEKIPKKVLNGNFYTTRPVGRPRTRWADVVQRDALQLLGIRGWRRRDGNRDEWRRL